MRRAYVELHRRGKAHSVEVWHEQDLCGGIYGVAIGSVFFGESMFSRRTDASKIALVALCRQLDHWGYGLLDCQVGNPHLFRMGAVELSRQAFQEWLEELLARPQPDGMWSDRARFETAW